MDQMSKGRVVIELDSAPPSLGVPTSGDYLERCVVSALFRPALRLVSATRESDYFEFVVEDGHRFSDGSPVQPEHVLRNARRERGIGAVGAVHRIPGEGSKSSGTASA